MKRMAVALVFIAGSGCVKVTDPEPVVCTAIAVSSLNVTVRDAVSALRVCDATVTAIHQGGERFVLERTIADPASCVYAGPWERAGVFEVRVAREGYAAAAVPNVRVDADECHVMPVSMTVDLRPLS
jgi:hypothetical protein